MISSYVSPKLFRHVFETGRTLAALKPHIITYVICLLGGRLSVSDGTLTIVAKNQAVMERVQEKVFTLSSGCVCVSVGYKSILCFCTFLMVNGLCFCLLDQQKEN